MKITRERLEQLPPEQRKEAERLLRELEAVYAQNPLFAFRPHVCRNCGQRYSNILCRDHRIPQHEFLSALTRETWSFMGNRGGKTTKLTTRGLIQMVPKAELPKHLQPYHQIAERRPPSKQGEPVVGWMLTPSAKVMETVTIPALRQWAPKSYLERGSFDSSWKKQMSYLQFKDGGRIHVFTYEQAADKLVGASIDWVALDEPPPKEHYEEAAVRIVDRNGVIFGAMTPVNMAGGGIGWIFRDKWKKRDKDPDLTVVTGSIHDNPLLPKDAVDALLNALGEPDDAIRRAREYGEFTHIGGLVYSAGFESVLVEPPEEVKGRDIVVGIDPGLKNAAFVWLAFDNDNRAVVFDECVLHEETPTAYAQAIDRVNRKWGLTRNDCTFVIDPSARNRTLTNAESVESLLQKKGIYCVHGYNAVEAGVQQIRDRMRHKMFLVSKDCKGLREEAEEYRMEDRPDGAFHVVKENDHRLDACRYATAYRWWDPLMGQVDPETVRWEGGKALSAREMQALVGSLSGPSSPLGSMS